MNTTDTAHSQFVVPPGFTTVPTPATDVVVPEAFSRWDPGQRRGYLAQRAINAAEGRTVAYAYDCVSRSTRSDQRRDPLDTAATMVSASMALSRLGAFRLVATAIELTERLPLTATLLTTGWIGVDAAHAIAEETALVEDRLMPELDRRISEGLAPTRRRTHPPRIGPLRKMLSKHVASCDPVGADARAQQARREQNVRMTPVTGDLALLTATLSAVDGLEITERIEALVRTAATDDPRSIGQLRAAGLLALSRGWTCLPAPDGDHPTDPDGMAAARRVVIHAYDDGDADFRGLFVAGYGPVSRFTSDELQRFARRRLDAIDTLADPDSEASRRYSPSEALARFCRGRDGTCVFPGCQTPADKTDLDHIIPFDHDDPQRGGYTTSDDLGSICRTHHRLKTDGIWAYYRSTDGDYVWIHGPNHPDKDPGTRVITTPTGPLAEFGAPRHPERSRLQKEAAEAGRTGDGIPGSQRQPHTRHRRASERRYLRAQAEQRLHAAEREPGSQSAA
ncbi:HNH endonuclease signature motif containing protein [Dietzia sp. KRD202]|uniref:HNH endonuclease signature motif containing protein n=1 Tax=Dietzia sp. KRD202 TaxID=2729732 RepID=UPI0019CF6A1F|nr:HNH endonuclease signature motif containing protein [Dietzia sp. KRD202]